MPLSSQLGRRGSPGEGGAAEHPRSRLAGMGPPLNRISRTRSSEVERRSQEMTACPNSGHELGLLWGGVRRYTFEEELPCPSSAHPTLPSQPRSSGPGPCFRELGSPGSRVRVGPCGTRLRLTHFARVTPPGPSRSVRGGVWFLLALKDPPCGHRPHLLQPLLPWRTLGGIRVSAVVQTRP